MNICIKTLISITKTLLIILVGYKIKYDYKGLKIIYTVYMTISFLISLLNEFESLASFNIKCYFPFIKLYLITKVLGTVYEARMI